MDDSIEKPGFSRKPPALGNIIIKHRTSIGYTGGSYKFVSDLQAPLLLRGKIERVI
jgi:hypothetical protein